MASPAITPKAPAIHPGWFSRAATWFSHAAKTVKNVVLKIAGDLPAVNAEISKVAPTVEAISELFLKGSGTWEAHLLDVWAVVASAVQSAGDAAGANGISVTFDQKLVADVKAILPAVQKFLHPAAGPNPPAK